MATGARVLVVANQPDVRALLRDTLEAGGLRVDMASDGTTALVCLHNVRPDLVVLDMGLPASDGLRVVERVRKACQVGLIAVSDGADSAARVELLDLGADDFVTAPFSPDELRARARAVLRRTRPDTQPMVFPGLLIDPSTREVRVFGDLVELTAREFDLLAFLASAPRQVFSRGELLTRVWGSSSAWQDPATVTEHVRRIRLKLEADADAPRWIATVRGVGYRFEG